MTQAGAHALGPLQLDVQNPQGYLHFWRSEATRFLAALQFDATETLRQAKLTSGATRQRLEQIAVAQSANRTTLLKILEPLLNHPLTQSMKVGHPVTAKANGNRLSENFANLFRDWAWDGVEVAEHLRTLQEHLPGGDLGDVCILGAGTGRLGYDLVQIRKCHSITLTEINPLLFLIGEKLMSGETLELYEVAELPKTSELATQKRILKADSKTQLNFLISDFLEDRLAPGSFDLVVTPWFVDVIPLPIEEIVAKINRLLKPGGTWINFGPLMFQTMDRSNLLPSNEWVELVNRMPFKIQKTFETSTTQLKSPLSATFRTDTMFSFSATKTGEMTTGSQPTDSALPAYLQDYQKGVKLAIDFEEVAQSHLLAADILNRCAEGKSILEIANELSADFGLPTPAVVPIVAQVVHDVYKNHKANPTLYLKN